MKIACSWSGGKDSCYALMQAVDKRHELCSLVNMMNENGQISRSHGLPLQILQQQAAVMNVPLLAQPTTWKDYQHHFVESLVKMKNEYKVEGIVFGDIDLQEHRDWEEMVCQQAGVSAILPLWKQERRELVMQMLKAGIQSMIVSCNTTLGEEFLGKVITTELVDVLDAKGVDPCGENGEFHTLVTNAPIFKKEIKIPAYSKVLHENYWFLQWAL